MWWGVRRRERGWFLGRREEGGEAGRAREGWYGEREGRAKEERIGHGREKEMAEGGGGSGERKGGAVMEQGRRGGFLPLLPKIAFITTNVDKPRPISQLLRAGCQAGL